LLLETRTSGSLPLEADLDVIEGFRIVISNMPPGPEHQGPALQRLIEPIVASLASTVGAGADVIQCVCYVGVGWCACIKTTKILFKCFACKSFD
jgi:hypothetical protein